MDQRIKGGRTGGMVQSLSAHWLSSRGPGFDFQHPHSASQPFITPIPWDPMLSSDASEIYTNRKINKNVRGKG